MGYSTVIRATRDCTALGVDGRAVPCTAHDIELASATVRTELLTPERTWWREQTRRDKVALHRKITRQLCTDGVRLKRGPTPPGELPHACVIVLAALDGHTENLSGLERSTKLAPSTISRALEGLLDRGLIRIADIRPVCRCKASKFYARVSDD